MRITTERCYKISYSVGQVSGTHLLVSTLRGCVPALGELREAIEEAVLRLRTTVARAQELVFCRVVYAYSEGVRLRALLKLRRVWERGEGTCGEAQRVRHVDRAARYRGHSHIDFFGW